MADYIHKSIAIKAVIDNCNKYHFADDAMLEIIADIDKEQPADVEEVIHARWEYQGFDIACSYCHKEALLDGHHMAVRSEYCPHCGAIMDGGGDNA